MNDQPSMSNQRDGHGERDSTAARHEEFLRLFAASHRRLFGYILLFVNQRADAEEVFQETCLTLWREFDKYDRSRDFVRWANGIAFNHVRRLRRNRQRDHLIFSEALMEDLARDEAAMARELDGRREALAECLTKLRDPDRRVLELYYSGRATAQHVAEHVGQSVHTVYKTLQRLRRRLHECVDRRLSPRQ